MNSKKILELCLGDGLGGLELFALKCYQKFSQQTTCKIVVDPETLLDKHVENENKYRLKGNRLFPILPAYKLAKYIDRYEIDILHFHWKGDMLLAIFAKLLTKRDVTLVQSRHMEMTRFKDDLYHRWLYKNIDLIHAVTNQVKDQLIKYIPEDIRPNIHMVYLGVEEMKVNHKIVKQLKEKHQLENEFIIGMVGRIEHAKGQYKLIEAISQLNNPEIKVMIVGSVMDDSYLGVLKKQIEEAGVEDNIIFTGFTKNVYEYMQLFDVNVLATDKETFGLVVVEAMINKIPMIATNTGGPLEIIDDSIDGFLFDGSSSDLAEKIQILYDNEELKKKISLKGYEKAKSKFNPLKQYQKLYEFLHSDKKIL